LLGGLAAWCSAFAALAAADYPSLVADRAAIERVYYEHRTGAKPAFEQALPPATLEKLVQLDLKKAAALKKVYGVEITPALVEAEVQRVNATTRAPEMLAELKTALGNDAGRFACTVAKPILVERELRERFENDDKLHAPGRRQMEQVRQRLLSAKQSGRSAEKLLDLLKQGGGNQVTETAWQLGARPLEKQKAESPDEIEIRKRFGPNAQILSSPRREAGRKFYFEDLPAQLQQVLKVQLRQAGDVSAVIEMPGGFVLYLAKEKTAETLSVGSLSIPKRNYEEWLEQQKE
jgi:hypothetical protein